MIELLLKIYFGSLYIFAAYASLYLYVHKYKRSSFKELADYAWCPFWKEIQHDMGLITKLNLYWNGGPPVYVDYIPRSILDIGSGNGITSARILSSIFGTNVRITLSDLHPNLDAWNKLNGIQYLANPIDISQHSLKGYSMISLLNSLHHLDEKLINILLEKAKKSNATIFIMDAKRLTPIHPLLIPNVYFCFYMILTFGGLFERGELFQLKSFPQLIIEPWIMCMDQMIGSIKRYHVDTLQDFAIKHGFEMKLSEDSLMNYFILTC
jgi:hypothetical protein